MLGTWAEQFRRFVSEYRAAGVAVWGVTAQNEPLTQTGLWGSNFLTAKQEIDWVAKFLSPALREDDPNIKIMVHDDQVTGLASRALQVAKALGEAADGVAYLWYNGLEGTFEDGVPETPLHLPKWLVPNKVNGGADVRSLWEQLPGTFMLMSEACSGYSLGTSWVGPRHGEWGYGYSTGHDMLWNLKNRAAGWVCVHLSP
eukprot:TRINITY_DN14241_c0_g1_i5.p3 TRINITY_DN14241_c0_g1~~TRINITY_DN14241_c0_g1_i5.p3  ORF type:complete len:200 (+),score=39.79 TRINITY_DN14241_c0_g1_i5:331-930(+)